MSRVAKKIFLSDAELTTLSKWVRSGKTENRLVFRARIILEAHRGLDNKRIAKYLNTTASTIGKWRYRFMIERIEGLRDAIRPGKPPKYGEEVDTRILDLLDQPAPYGQPIWTGPLIAEELGDVSVHQVWRVLSKYGISLSMQHNMRISYDSSFMAKTAAIVGLYLNPPDKAIVISVNQKLPNKNVNKISDLSNKYSSYVANNLFYALEVHTSGSNTTSLNKRPSRRGFLNYLNCIVREYPNTDIHVIHDNIHNHNPRRERWLKIHKNVNFHFTPTKTSWINQVEIWFCILWEKSTQKESSISIRQLRKHIDQVVESINESKGQFEWQAVKANI